MAENHAQTHAAPQEGARAFNRETAPAYLDHACMINGFAPPPGSPVGEGQDAGFAWCELHCGSATTAALLAASNPLGDFHGIDAREELLEDGRALAREGGVKNLTLHRADTEAALELSLPMFDYVVVAGVYSWVPMRERGLVLAFLRKFLKPGGVAYVTYNARPGWNALDSFRRLFREATRGMKADPRAKLKIARELYAKLEETRAPAVVASGLRAASLEELENIPPERLAADFDNDFAEPVYVSEIASDFAAIDCALAGSAEMVESLPVLMAHEPFKSVLEVVPTPMGRELAKDMMRNTRFRRDVFVRGGKRISADNRETMLAGLAFALERPAAETRFEARMPFGVMKFDTEVAHTLAAALESGPKTLGQLLGDSGNDPDKAQAVLGAIHALLISGQIRPVYRRTREGVANAAQLRKAILARAATRGAIAFLPSGFGTGFFVPVPDQIFAGEPEGAGGDALADAAIEKLGGKALPGPVRDNILKRARAFRTMEPYYRAIGVRGG